MIHEIFRLNVVRALCNTLKIHVLRNAQERLENDVHRYELAKLEVFTLGVFEELVGISTFGKNIPRLCFRPARCTCCNWSSGLSRERKQYSYLIERKYLGAVSAFTPSALPLALCAGGIQRKLLRDPASTDTTLRLQ